MRQSTNRSETQAFGLTLATLLCVAALADASAATVVLQGRRDGSSLGEQRRFVERMVQQFQEWQVALVAVRPTRPCSVCVPVGPRLSAPVTDARNAAPRRYVRLALLNLPPPRAAL